MSPRILFIANAGPSVGGGHVMRSLTLARALQAEGATCAFAATPEVAAVLDAFAPDMPKAPADKTGEAFDAVVLDHYDLSADDQRRLAAGRPALVIDDLADRPLAADIVLDAEPVRLAEHYAGLVPAETELLLGPAFAPVRPAFAERRSQALAARAGRPPSRALVSLGLTDVGGITGKVVNLLRPLAHDLILDVVAGAGAASLPALRAQEGPSLALHVDAKDMASLIADADLAIGAGGSSAWERCVLGLPSLCLVLADNQVDTAHALEANGAAVSLDVRSPDFDALFADAFSDLIAAPDRLARMSQAAASLCDGLGAPRVARRLLAQVRQSRPPP